MAFTVERPDVEANTRPKQIYVVPVAGGTPTAIATEGSNSRPRWTTDSKRIVFISTRGRGTSQAWIMNADGSDQKAITSTPTGAGDVTVSPDDKWIVFGDKAMVIFFSLLRFHLRIATLRNNQTESAQVVWSKTGRGSYMPTPLFYRGQLYMLANNGVFDAYDALTGKEMYRERLTLVGSGFSASPVAADGKIYLANEDGEMLVVQAGSTFRHVATNSMGETVMATPALSERVMFVRVFAIGRR